MKYKLFDIVFSLILFLIGAAGFAGVIIGNGFLSEWLGYDFAGRTMFVLLAFGILHLFSRNFFHIWEKNEKMNRIAISLLFSIPLYFTYLIPLAVGAIMIFIFASLISADHSEKKHSDRMREEDERD